MHYSNAAYEMTMDDPSLPPGGGSYSYDDRENGPVKKKKKRGTDDDPYDTLPVDMQRQ